MKTFLRIFVLLCVLIGLLCVFPQGDISAATTTSTFTHTRVTTDSYDDYYPQVSGDYVVWQGDTYYEDSSSSISRTADLQYEIYLYQISTGVTTRLTDNTNDEYNPQIDGDNVVWKGNGDGDYEIYHYAISTGVTTKVTNNSANDSSQQVNGDYIVWNSDEGGDYEVYLYKISTGITTQVTVNTGDDYGPRIDGDYIVWYGDSDGDEEIYLYTISTGVTTKISNNTINDENPRISGNYVSWGQYADGQPQDAFLYNISSGVTTQMNFTSASDPYYLRIEMDGDYVALCAGDDGYQEIFLHSISTTTTTQVTDDAPMDVDPEIDGNFLVWEKSDEIFLYEIDQDATSQLSTFTGFVNNYRPQVEGSYVAWYGSTGGANPKEILLVGINIPAAPVLTSPANGASTYVDTSPTFEWNAVTGAVSYTFEYSQDDTFATSTTATTSNTTYAPGELAVGTWYWRVNASNGTTVGEWSEVWSYTILQNAPILLSPVDGFSTSDHTPNFDWEDLPGAVSYVIQISPDADFTRKPIVRTVTSSFYSPGISLNNNTYYWRVIANMGGTLSEWSEVRSIIITGSPGNVAPVAQSPADGATTTDRTPTFDWTDVATAVRYRFQMSPTEDFSVWVVNQTMTDSEFTPGVNFNPGTYWWRVQAEGGGDSSWFTVKRSFTVVGP